MSGELSGVRVAHAAIRRRLEANGGDNVFLVFKANGVTMRHASDLAALELMAASAAAVEEANEVLPDDVWAEGPMHTSVGPFINLDWIGTDEQNNAWLTTFAGALAERGYTGTVTVAPQAHLPPWLGNSSATPRLTIFTAYRMPEPLPPPAKRPSGVLPQFGLDPTMTQALCERAVAWGRFNGAETFLGQGATTIKVTDPQVADILEAGMARHWMAGVDYVHTRPQKARSVDFAEWGQVIDQITEPETGWADLIDEAVSALTFSPQSLDLGLIRYKQNTANSWRDLGEVFPKLPAVDSTSFFYCRQVWDQYVPEAHAVQVLTGRHMEKANNLDNWTVTALSADRYLVQAPDLASWFDGPIISYAIAPGIGLYPIDPDDPQESVYRQYREPYPEVVAAARADFGEMIMTQEVAKANWGW